MPPKITAIPTPSQVVKLMGTATVEFRNMVMKRSTQRPTMHNIRSNTDIIVKFTVNGRSSLIRLTQHCNTNTGRAQLGKAIVYSVCSQASYTRVSKIKEYGGAITRIANLIDDISDQVYDPSSPEVAKAIISINEVFNKREAANEKRIRDDLKNTLRRYTSYVSEETLLEIWRELQIDSVLDT